MSNENDSKDMINENDQFESICRTCLYDSTENNNLTMLNLIDYFDINKNIKLSDMLFECTSIQVSNNDQLPKLICQKCVDQINTSYDFKINCLKTEQTILNQLMSLRKQNFENGNYYSDNIDSKYDLSVKLENNIGDDIDFDTENVHDIDDTDNDNDNTSPMINIGKRCSKRIKRRNLAKIKNDDFKTSETKWFTKTPNGSYKCTVCGVIKSKRRLLKAHVSQIHDNEFNFKCSFCNQIFTKKYSMRRHELSHHQSQNDKLDSDNIKNEKSFIDNDIKMEISSILCDDNEIEEINDGIIINNIKVENFNEKGDNIIDENNDENRALAEKNIEKINLNNTKRYKCKMCGIEKPNITNMINHIYFHLNIRRFQCHLCDKYFVTRGNMNRHILDVHDNDDNTTTINNKSTKLLNNKQEPRICTLCNDQKYYQTLVEYQRHMCDVHNEKMRKGYNPVVCNICNKQVYNNNALRKHINAIHLTKSYKCDLCTMSYHSEKSLLGHRRVHGIKSGYHCKYCIQTYDTELELNDHINSKHQNAQVYKCTKCDKEFYIQEYLLKHIKNHEAKPKHLCTICGKTFLLKSNLTTHLRIHTGEKPYKCSICSTSFGQHAALRFHQAVHTDERKFECTICNTKWKRKIDLTQHMRLHTDVPHFKCNFCGKEFIFRKRLTCHLKIHTGEKPYECTTCGKTFNRASHLKVHNRIHTGERPFVCSVCGRGFIQNHCLITHMNTHHKQQSEQQ